MDSASEFAISTVAEERAQNGYCENFNARLKDEPLNTYVSQGNNRYRYPPCSTP